MVLMYADPARTAAMTRAERAEVMAKHEELGAELEASGELLNGCGLGYPAETRTLRWNGASTDGPCHGGVEQLTAYYVLDCVDAARAEAVAARLLDFHVTSVEVRAVHDSFGFAD
jgi:hypothetical protein